MTPTIDVTDLVVEVDGTRIVDGVTVRVDRGEVVGVLGPNGSGKSTLLRCVYGARRPGAGVVRLAGTDVTRLRPPRRARLVAVVPQENVLDFDLTVTEVAEMGALTERRRGPGGQKAIHDRVSRALDSVGMAHASNRSFPTLSGGEKQRVLIARAFVQNCPALVLDEPTNHLDIGHQLAAMEMVRGSDSAVLCALHDLNVAAQYCDRVLLLDHGRVRAQGTPADVLTRDVLTTVYGVDATTVVHPESGIPQLLFRSIEKRVENP